MEFTQSPNRQWDFEFKSAFKISSTTVINKKSRLKFKIKKFNNDTKLMKWNISSTKKSIQFEGTVYPNKLPANEYLKMVKQSKKSYKIIESLLIN
jgi:hypothetical protein